MTFGCLIFTVQLPANFSPVGSARVGREASSSNGLWKDVTVLPCLGQFCSSWRIYKWSLSYWPTPSRILFPLHGWSWRV